MKKRYGLRYRWWLMLLIGWATTGLFSCMNSGEAKRTPADTKKSGTITISADESFKPVIDAAVKVFESDGAATIHVQYKPEAACLQDLLSDSIRMVIIARTLTPEQKAYVVDSLQVVTTQMIMAYDAVAVIVNPASAYDHFTMEELKQVLTGRFKKNLIPVFDGLRATSTVSFIIDSVLRGDSLTPRAVAANTSEEVIDYVARTPDAVGFIGVSWVGNPEDNQQQSFLKKVKLALLQSRDDPDDFIIPWQLNIYEARYPMLRKLVYVLKESHNGLGHGFADFLMGERGQLLFRRSYLLPSRYQFLMRKAGIRE